MDSTTAEPCETLPWDTKFFGMEVARVSGDVLTPAVCKAIDEWCKSHRIDCLYFSARADDATTVKLAEERGYHLVDVRVTSEHSSESRTRENASGEECRIRIARAEDVPALRRIARVSHSDTRFFYDDRFPRTLCESLYETWIQKSCEGFANAVLVAEDAGPLCGYVTCHLSSDGTKGSIGLIAVDGQWQCKGLGRCLVDAALDWFETQRVTKVSVVTQGRNIAAQRLYARGGFIPRKVELYYHRWFP